MTNVTIRFTDNQSGSGTNVSVNPNGHSQSVNTLLAGTNVAKDGSVTSVELQSDFQGITCVVKKNNQEIARATANNNSVSFQRTPISELTIEVTRA